MDDLAGLDWSAPSKQTATSTPTTFALPQHPTPQLSGRSTPLSAQQSAVGAANSSMKPPSKPATPANDSFAALIARNSSKPASSQLSLQERQKQLQDEKLKQEADRQKQYAAHFGASDPTFWDTMGSGKSTPEPSSSASSGVPRLPIQSSGGSTLSRTINRPFSGLDTSSRRPVVSPPADDDLLSAFNSAAPVDSSSHFPKPSSFSSSRSTPAHDTNPFRAASPLPPPSTANTFDDDDDMFGLNQLPKNNATSARPAYPTVDADDDILGLLGKPVSEFKREPEPFIEEHLELRHGSPDSSPGLSPDLNNPQAKAVAELVDMGFPADKAAIALATTESGLDVQAAVGYILNQAHAEAKQKTRGDPADRPRRSPDELDERPRRHNTRPDPRESSIGASKPSWMRGDDERSRSSQGRPDGQSTSQEKDVAQFASEFGTTLFKSANSLWKTGRKQVQKAVADLQQAQQQDGDNSVPKWMRNTPDGDDGERAAQPRKPRRDAPSRMAADVTDEAMMLESGGRPAISQHPSERRHTPDPHVLRQRREPEEARNGFPSRNSSQSPAIRQPTPGLDKRPAARLTRQEVEEQTAQAYISPSRRKKNTPQPAPNLNPFTQERPASSAPPPREAAPSHSNNPFLQTKSAPKSRSPAPTPPAPKPRAPPRRIPPASSSALSSSASYRQKGSEAFKRGDYSAAHAAYTSALGPLPDTHPITIIVLCNRALTNIKVGDPKAAVSDADAALAIIGVSKGEGEKIVMGGTEADKDMKELYGKALMRKAEALEAMEKWADAGKVWRAAVEAGVGGSICIQGRNRCDKAAGEGDRAPTPAAKPLRKPPPPKVSALADLGGRAAPDSEAVRNLKAANAAAEKADDEKFALTDQVDAKLHAWKGSKSDNLRALLGSLDKVLWPEAGWKKVNMGDLVMANKVKISYMKAIAKVHPDKIPQTATVEQRMISGAVFATLNEAWDKFKKENGM